MSRRLGENVETDLRIDAFFSFFFSLTAVLNVYVFIGLAAATGLSFTCKLPIIPLCHMRFTSRLSYILRGGGVASLASVTVVAGGGGSIWINDVVYSAVFFSSACF